MLNKPNNKFRVSFSWGYYTLFCLLLLELAKMQIPLGEDD